MPSGRSPWISRHERRLLEILLLHAIEEGAVVAVERLELGAGAARLRRCAPVLGLHLGLGQPGPEPHLFVDQRARAALGERGLAAQEIEEGPGSAPLGEGEGLLRTLGLEGKVDRVVVDTLLAFEESAAQRGVSQIRAELLDVAHGFPRRRERLFRAAEPGQRAGKAVVEVRVVGDTPHLIGERDGLLVDPERLRPVLARQGQAPLAAEDIDLDLTQPAQPRMLERPVERRVCLVGMAEGELSPPDAQERAGGPSTQVRAAPLRREGREPRLRALEVLGGLGIAGQRRLEILLGIGDLSEIVQEEALDLLLVPAAQASLGELEPLFERLGRLREVAHRPIRRAEMGIAGSPRAEVGLFQVAGVGFLEELDASARRLDAFLIAAEANGNHRGSVPGPRRSHLVAFLLGLGGGALVVGERLTALTTIDGLDRLRAIERIFARRRRLRGRLLGRTVPSPTEAPLRFGRRHQRERYQHPDERSVNENPRAHRSHASRKCPSGPAALAPLTSSGPLATITPVFHPGRCVSADARQNQRRPTRRRHDS